MPRRVQDIIPNGHRSIRDVKPVSPAPAKKSESRRNGTAKCADDTQKVPLHRLKITPPPMGRSRGSERRPSRIGKILMLVVFIVIVAAGVAAGASAYFSKATFTIVPRSVPLSVNATVVASGTSTPGYLAYQSILLDATASSTISATSGAPISMKAQGTVMIYNAYGAQPQRLVAGTRLAGDAGLVYRLTGSIIVPGYTISAGKLSPGSIVTPVIADQPGQQYNVSAGAVEGDWKIIAYQGTPKYDGFYARPSSEISGGYLGQKETIDPGLLASTSADLSAALTAHLLADAKAAVPADLIMYSNAYTESFSVPAIGPADAPNQASVTVHGTLYAILFDRSSLVVKLAGTENTSSFGAFPYDTPGLDSLVFAIDNTKDFSPATKSVLIAHFSGPLKLIGIVPTAALKAKLAGAALSKTGSILEAYSPVIDIAKSAGELSPPWISHVPTDQSKIEIDVTEK